MMRLYSGELWSAFVAAKISPQIIFLTAGELGISKTSSLTPAEMAKIRMAETHEAMKFLQASYTFLDFSDLSVSFIPLENLVKAVLPLIRNYQTDALFSFHPCETTVSFDHPDHNIAGVVTKYVGAAADVQHFMPQFPALKKRPELYLWTTQSGKTNHVVPLDERTRQDRNNYLINYYPSQFSLDQIDEWSSIFECITYSSDFEHQEQYMKVR